MTRTALIRTLGRRAALVLSAAVIVTAVAGAIAPATAADAGAGPATGEHHWAGSPQWTGTWATALTVSGGFSGFDNQSVRMLVRSSIGGTQLRVRLSNAYGDRQLTVGRASVGRPVVDSRPDLDPGSLVPLTFGGGPAVTIPQGGSVLSDPVPVAVAPLSQLAVTLYFPEPTGAPSVHLFAKQTTYVYDGDRASDPAGSGHSSTNTQFYFLTGIEIAAPAGAVDGAVAVLGASISDGFGIVDDTNTRWPDLLADRIQRTHDVDELGVLNVSLSGNALTVDGDEDGLPLVGPRAIDRLDDHLSPHAGIRTVIVDLGLTDIFRRDAGPSEIITALRELTAELRSRGYRVLVATLSPAASSTAGNWSARREATRQLVNSFIRTGRGSDGVVDIDRALRDPAQPTLINPAFDSGDGVHQNAAGSQAIADAVDLRLL